MRLLILFLVTLSLSLGAHAAPSTTDNDAIAQALEQAKTNKNQPGQAELIETLQAALNALDERAHAQQQADEYQQVIDNFPKLSQSLRQQLATSPTQTEKIPA